MAKKIFIVDFHAGKNGLEFLDYQLDNFDRVVEYADNHNITEYINLGDTYDMKKQTNSKVVDSMNDRFFSKFKGTGRNMIAIVGNHDGYYEDSNEPALVRVHRDKDIRVISQPTEINGDMYLPYHFDLDDFSQYRDVFAHLDIVGYEMNDGVVASKGHPESLFNNTRNVISGHYHKRNMKGRVKYPGAMQQLEFGMFGCIPGFTVYDSVTGEFEFIENKKSPKFVKVFYTNGDVEVEGCESGRDITDDYIDLYIKKCNDLSELTKFKSGLNHIKYETNLEVYTEFSNDQMNDDIDDEEVMINEYFRLNYGDNQHHDKILKYFADCYMTKKDGMQTSYRNNVSLMINSLMMTNFMGYQDTTTINYERGLFAVIGNNGCGKTSQLEAIHYAIYGKSMTGKTIPSLINKDVKKRLLVGLNIVSGGKNVEIKRGTAPRVLQLTVDGEDIKDGIQERIDSIIGLTAKQFTYLVIKNKDIYKEFSEMKISEKREFIDKMFNLEIYTDIAEMVGNDLTITKRRMVEVARDIEEQKNLLEKEEEIISDKEEAFNINKIEKIEIHEDNKKSIEDRINKIISTNRKELVEIRSEIESIDIKLTEIEDDTKIKKLKQVKDTLIVKRDGIVNDIAIISGPKLEDLLRVNIETETKMIREVEDEKLLLADQDYSSYENEIKTFKKQMDDIRNERDFLPHRLEKLKTDNKSKLDKHKKCLDDERESLKDLETELAELNNDKTKLDDFKVLAAQFKKMKALCGDCSKIVEYASDISVQTPIMKDISQKISKIPEINTNIKKSNDKIIRLTNECRKYEDEDIYLNDKWLTDKEAELDDENTKLDHKIQHQKHLMAEKKNDVEKRDLILSNRIMDFQNAKIEEDIRIKDNIQNEITEKNKEKEEITDKISKIDKTIDTMMNNKEINKKNLSDSKVALKERETSVQAQLDENSKELADCVTKIELEIKAIKSLKFDPDREEADRLIGVIENLNEQQEKIFLDEVIQTTIQKMLRSKGSIKNFIIEYYIGFINVKFHEYFRQYSFPFQIVWDSNFEAKLYGSNYEDLTITSLSSGQRKAVDLSLVFTFGDLQEKLFDATVGFTYYDEICSGFHPDKLDVAINILKGISKNRCIYITEPLMKDFSIFDGVFEVTQDVNGSKITRL